MLAEFDGLLRAEGPYKVGAARVPVARFVLLLCLGGIVYGAAMGSYSMRPLQMAYSAAKVPMLLSLSTVVCLPSFFVVNTLLGLRDDFPSAMRAVLACQATVAIGLLAMMPIVLFLYASSDNYRFAIQANGFLFLLATLAGQRGLDRHYRPLVEKDPRHRIARRLWIVLYVFVAVQLAWVLRPFVGSPELDVRFFREGAWSNAYLVIFKDVLGFGLY